MAKDQEQIAKKYKWDPRIQALQLYGLMPDECS